MASLPHELVVQVLQQFTATASPASQHGGFSGALVYRCDGGASRLCLRAWPVGVAPDRLDWVHELMQTARAAGLAFVPRPHPTRSGRSWVFEQQRLWDLTDWMPGEATFHREPTPARLAAACTALAQIHHAWRHPETRRGPCPAVERRIHTLRRWQRLLRSGWRPTPGTSSPALTMLTPRAWDLLGVWVPRLPDLLYPWSDVEVSLRACLCDVWHDHLLFEGDTLTGLIDYGEAKLDNVSVDLARMLGSLVGDDEGRWEAGLEAYRRVRPLTAEEEALTRVLDRTGVVLGASNWLRWLYHDGRQFDDLETAARRLADLVARMERRAAD